MRYGGARFIPPSKITEIAIAWPEMLIAGSFAQWGMRLPRKDDCQSVLKEARFVRNIER